MAFIIENFSVYRMNCTFLYCRMEFYSYYFWITKVYGKYCNVNYTQAYCISSLVCQIIMVMRGTLLSCTVTVPSCYFLAVQWLVFDFPCVLQN